MYRETSIARIQRPEMRLQRNYDGARLLDRQQNEHVSTSLNIYQLSSG
jgi:hypothetical protein